MDKYMFGNKLLVYVRQPSVYNLRRIRSVEERKATLSNRMLASKHLTVSANNQEYADAYELVVKEQEAHMMKYEKSVLWSPVFTPTHFRWMFVIPAIGVLLLMLYVRYIAQPKKMMEYKKKYGAKFKDLEARGWLESWMDEYYRPDQVLTFEAYSVKDLEMLYKEGLLTGGNEAQRQAQEQQAQKRKNKFVSGTKEFVMREFNKA